MVNNLLFPRIAFKIIYSRLYEFMRRARAFINGTEVLRKGLPVSKKIVTQALIISPTYKEESFNAPKILYGFSYIRGNIFL